VTKFFRGEWDADNLKSPGLKAVLWALDFVGLKPHASTKGGLLPEKVPQY